MIKKISAIVLALVLCLSVIVVPASAAKVELGDAKMAFSLEWDKESYSAGETAYLSVYMDAADDLSLYTGSFLIGLNSSVFPQSDNPIATVQGNSEVSELFNSYWKGTTNFSWLNTSIVPRVEATNTPEENAKFDQYLKFTAARNSAGSHDNVANTKDGFHGDEFNPDEAIMVIGLVIGADVPDGTVIEAAITSGSITSNPAQTAWKYYTNPGNATTTGNLTGIDVTQTVVSATVGEVESSIVEWSKAQIRFRNVGSDGDFSKYGNEFDVRTVAKISADNFNATFESEDNAKAKITDLGFVYAAKSNVDSFDVETAKVVAQGGSADNYVKKSVTYMQNTGDEYIFTCLIESIPDASKTDGVTCLAFVEYDGQFYFFDAAVTVEYNDLYSTWFKG